MPVAAAVRCCRTSRCRVRGVVSACSCRPRCSVGDDHDSAAGDVGFHRRMRLDVSFRSKTRPVRTAASRPPPARGAPAAASPGKSSTRPSRREGDARRDDIHRREVSERTAVTDHARRAYDPRLSHRRDRVRQRRRAYQFEHLVGAVLPGPPHCVRERTVVEEEVVGATATHRRLSRPLAGGRGDLRTVRSCDGWRRKADRSGAAADQQPDEWSGPLEDQLPLPSPSAPQVEQIGARYGHIARGATYSSSSIRTTPTGRSAATSDAA